MLAKIKSVCLSVGAWVSKHTAICVGFSLLRISSKVFVKPKMAEVLNPFELMRGLLLNAK